MNAVLARFSGLVTAHPKTALLVMFAIVIALGAGGSLRAPLPETVDTLPEGGAVDRALEEIDEYFGEFGAGRVVTLLFRGDAISPGGLSQMADLLNRVVADPAVSELLAHDNPVAAPTFLVQAMLQVDSFESVTRAQVDDAPVPPELRAALDALTGTDTDGTEVAIAVVRLRDTGDERVAEAERRIGALAADDQGPLKVTSISPAIVEDEYKRATEEGMAPLIGLALLLIAGILLLFLRTISDLLLTLLGLVLALTATVGIEGWLGPNGLALTGSPNSLTALTPVIIIGLTVDYAIQIVSHYREQRLAGAPVTDAARTGLSNVTVPLVLAAVTTIVSLLASLFSPIGIVGDFGVNAGLGVGLSLLIMLTLLPAGRTIIDRRRESRGTLSQPRPIATALPGVGRVAQMLGRGVTRRPAPYIVGVLLVTASLGYLATDLESEFSIRDILPRGGELLRDMDTLDAAVGGSTELASVLIKAEATETRTVLNLEDLTHAFADEGRRPGAAAGPIQASYVLLIEDWTADSGEPGDKYDADLAALFREASSGIELDQGLMQELLDRMGAMDPAVERVLRNNPDGPDVILVEFPTFSGVPALTKALQSDIEALWLGDDGSLTATSDSIISVTVTDAITERQTEAISATIVVALAVLALFFWATLRQPGLAIIAVGPIVLVLISVLGTMALLGIPYTLITSIITALSIGIGVDYTIHMIHRYREEYAVERNPEQAAIRTLGTTGSALLGSAMTTALGLGVLVASPLAASQQFGFTAAITIAYSLIVSTVLVPPAMTVWGAYQNMRLRSMVQNWADELDMAIDAVHRRHEQES